MRHHIRYTLLGVVLFAFIAASVWSEPYSVLADANETAITGLNATSQSSISGGYSHTCALLSTGAVKCWGRNTYGQLGDGTSTNGSEPVQVSELTSGVTAISAGDDHTCALLSTGAVKCWGRGIGSTPTQIFGLDSGVTAISAGGSHTCAIQGGAAKCWGANTYGQVGDGTFTSPVATPTQVSGLTSGVTAIAAGTNHTCALLSTGVTNCWGKNTYYQVGDGSNADRNAPVQVTDLTSGVTAISAGDYHTCALLSTGAAKCWGWNSFGQIGDLTTTSPRSAPTQVWGLTSGVTAISTGQTNTCALLSTGAAKCWGANADGRVGDGTLTNRTNPTQVLGLTSGVTAISAGNYHTCALLSTGAVKCWGRNEFGGIGDGTLTSTNTNGPTQVIGLTSGVGVSPMLTVAYDTHDGSTVSDGDTSTTTGATINTLPTDPTRTGYTFNGWYTAASGGTQITTNDPHGQTSDFTLHAQWTANTLTVTYDTHGGSAVSDGDTSTTTGATITTLPTDPTRAGYTFNGWYTAASGGIQITTNDPHGQTSDFTLHARWTANPTTSTTTVVPVVTTTPSPTSSITPSTTTVSTTAATPTSTIPEPQQFGSASAVSSSGASITSNTDQISTNEEVILIIRNSDGTELTVTHRPLRVRTAFDVDLGSTLSVTGSGYQPGTDITLWLYSAPTQLGSTTTNNAGHFTTDLTIPTSIDIGAHTLSIQGLTAAGTNTTRIGITTNAPVAELPTTGPESDTPISVALILIAVGILTRLRTRNHN